MTQKLLSVLVVVISFNLFFYGFPFPQFGTVGFWLLVGVAQVFGLVTFFSGNNSFKQSVALSTAGLAIALATISLWKANEVDIFLLGLTSLFLTTVSYYLYALTPKTFGAVSEMVIAPLQVFLGWLAGFAGTIDQIPTAVMGAHEVVRRSPVKVSVTNDKMAAILRGLIITIPVLFVIVTLLMSADPIFSKMLGRVFEVKLPTFALTIPMRLVYSVIIAILVAPFTYLTFKDRYKSPFQHRGLAQFRWELLMLVGSITITLALFLAIQFRDLFTTVGETELHQFGVNTFSEYVRKGFSELTIVAIIVYGVVGASLTVFRQLKERNTWLQRFNILLLFEAIIFIFSIFRRVMLYQAEHGLTRIRIYGSLFLVMLMALTVVLILRHIVKKPVKWYLFEGAIVLAALVAVTLGNVDRAIATTFKPTVNKEVDYVYISRLSADGYAGWVEGIDHATQVLAAQVNTPRESGTVTPREVVYAYQTISNVSRNYEYLALKYGTKEEVEAMGLTYKQQPFQVHNFGEKQAYHALKELVPWSRLQQLKQQANALYSNLSPDEQTRSYDRSSDTPLLD